MLLLYVELMMGMLLLLQPKSKTQNYRDMWKKFWVKNIGENKSEEEVTIFFRLKIDRPHQRRRRLASEKNKFSFAAGSDKRKVGANDVEPLSMATLRARRNRYYCTYIS